MEPVLEVLPWLAAGLVMLALAAALLWFGFGRPVNRVLALALTLHGLMDLTVFARWLAPDAGGYVARVFPYLWLPLAPAFLAFASLYPERRAWMRQGWWGSFAMMGLVFALPFLYFVDHGLYDGYGALAGLTGTGPLVAATFVLHVAYGLIAFLFARAALRAPAGSSRRSGLLLGSIAFALIHLYDAVQYIGDWRGGNPYAGTALAGVTGIILASDVAALLVYVPLGALVARHALRDPDATTRRTMRAYAALLGLAAFLGAFFIVFRDTPGIGAGGPRWILAGLWDLTFPLIFAYAVLKHQLLDVDVKVRWTVKQSTVAAMFIGVFFVVTELAKDLLSGGLGPYVGIAAAGLLVFALAPLQRAAERVAEVAMPHPRAPKELSHPERVDAFRTAAVAAWDDGRVDARERYVLDHLRDALGLSFEEAARLESEAARSFSEPRPSPSTAGARVPRRPRA